MAVRILLLLTGTAAFRAPLPQGQAGTAAAPEIQDPAKDQAFADTQDTCLPTAPPAVLAQCTGDRIDILSAWIDNETAADFHINILVSNAPLGPTTYAPLWRATFIIAGTTYVASASAPSQPPNGATGVPAPGGVATASPV